MQYSELFNYIIKGDITSFKEAICSGFNVNEVDQHGFSLLHRACANNQPEIVLFLLDLGSSVNITATDNWSPLHLTSVSGAIQCISLLAKANIDMNAKDKNGCTALHLSVTSRNSELSRELIKHGCTKDVVNNDGQTPLDYAKSKSREQFYSILS